ncbi:MAG: hypothetical protein J6A59_09225 [Lachnospiraceae bacterium]|nr:hypothetical protein [Lachnospiraceae bacterium]
MRIITFTGKSGCGKSTQESQFEKLGFIRLISYTTRKPREYEVNDRDYHFVTHERFNELFKKGYIIEKTKYADNLYGLEQPVGGTDYVAVVETDGVKSLKEIYGNQVISIYLDIDAEIATSRRNERNFMNINENMARDLSDDTKFENIEDLVDIVISVRNKDAKSITAEILQKVREFR